MRILITFLFLSLSGLANENDLWLDQVKTRTDQDVVNWLRAKIKKDFQMINQVDLTTFTQQPCKNCFSGGLLDMGPKIYVFMSFSVPEETWLKLSSELEDYSGVFIVRGLPNNSFQELAIKLAKLKQQGMKAAVLIDPNLFKQFQIQNVPAFVFIDGATTHKISGNISLEYALKIANPELETMDTFLK